MLSLRSAESVVFVRRIQNLSDVQIVVNDILNRLAPLENSILNRRGFRITNLGEAQDDTDAPTLGQVKALLPDLPSIAYTKSVYTQIWDTQGTAATTDVIPAYCITENERTGFPTRVWLSCRTAGAADMKINIKYEVKEVQNENGDILINAVAAKYLLVDGNGNQKDLKLKAGQFLVFSSSFVIPTPFFPIGTRLFPEITAASDNDAPSIGLVITRATQAALR